MMTTINNVVCLCLFQKLDTTQPSMARDWRTGPTITMPSRSAAACTSYVVGWLVGWLVGYTWLLWLVTLGYCRVVSQEALAKVPGGGRKRESVTNTLYSQHHNDSALKWEKEGECN